MLAYTAFLTVKNWPLETLAGVLWIALSLVISLPVLCIGRPLAKRLRANPVSSAKQICTTTAFVGLLLGSSAGLFLSPLGVAASLALVAIGLVVFSAFPLAQMVFLASYAFGVVMLGARAMPLQAVVFALLFSFAGIWVSAVVRFSRTKTAMALHRGRFSRLIEQKNTFVWETDAEGHMTQASRFLLQILGVQQGEAPACYVWAVAQSGTGLRKEQLAENELGAEVLRRIHETQSSFSDLVVNVSSVDGVHRLSLSGRPQYDATGGFAGFIGAGLDLTEFSRKQERLLAAAERDALTKLMNRACFNEHLEDRLSQPRGRSATALLLIDLDKFKQANDTLGHQVGDLVLRQFSDRLRTFINADGFAGRLGGDEFGVVLNDISSKKRLAALCGELIPYLSAPYEVSGTRVSIGATIGIAIAPEHGDTVDALVRNADLALYSAKARGGGQHRFFDATLLEHAIERRRLEMDLGNAIEKGEITVLYQPIVDAANERLCGFEALARWEHPERGDVAPDQFIPLAEASGLIDKLGEWVLREACAAAAHWPPNIRLAVNLSPSQFRSASLASVVVNSLARSKLEPGRLEIEITESVFLQETESTQAILQQLHNFGIRWTLDDFGTGYSSLKYLLKAPFSKIKIDREFVNGLSIPGSQKRPIVGTIVALAENLGMETTAEGVESKSDLMVARELGCSQIQGFVYGPKLTEAEARSLAKSRMPMPAEGYEATRCEPRLVVLRSADVVHKDNIFPGTVRNVSSSGAMVESEWTATIGERVELHMDHEQPRSGVIRWVEGIRFGVQFDEKAEVASHDQLVDRRKTPRSRAA